jgi:hypothetical protein
VQDKSAGCQDGANGWQYSADGTKVLLCGSACDEVRSDPNAKVDIEFGCETKVKSQTSVAGNERPNERQPRAR